MRSVLILIPVAMVGGFAIHQAATRPREPACVAQHLPQAPMPRVAVAVPRLPNLPALPEIPESPELPEMVVLSEALSSVPANIEVHIPHVATIRADVLADEIRLHAAAAAQADIEATVSGVLEAIERHLAENDLTEDQVREMLEVSGSVIADLAASIEASVVVKPEEGDSKRPVKPIRRRR